MLACPLVYDELGLTEATILKACLKKSQEVIDADKMSRSPSIGPRSGSGGGGGGGGGDSRRTPRSNPTATKSAGGSADTAPPDLKL